MRFDRSGSRPRLGERIDSATERTRARRARGEPLQHGEVLLELNYRLSLAKWLWLQPDVQGIIQPKGRSDVPDAIVVGFAVGVVL